MRTGLDLPGRPCERTLGRAPAGMIHGARGDLWGQKTCSVLWRCRLNCPPTVVQHAGRKTRGTATLGSAPYAWLRLCGFPKRLWYQGIMASSTRGSQGVVASGTATGYFGDRCSALDTLFGAPSMACTAIVARCP